MRNIAIGTFALAVAGFVAAGLSADDKKEVTLKGQVLCHKCELKQADKCTTAIAVKEGEKEAIYLLIDKGTGEGYHEAVCGGGRKEGTVTGVVSEKDGKKYITPSKVEIKK